MNISQIKIRFADKTDMSAVLNLIQELADYEHASHEVSNSVEQLIEEGFGEQPAFECLVAEYESTILGFAIFYTAYSTWKGKVLYLEDICVKENYRRKGIGQLLFEKLIDLSKERKVKRFAWQVLNWNKPAIEFYKKYSTEFDAEWINCRIKF